MTGGCGASARRGEISAGETTGAADCTALQAGRAASAAPAGRTSSLPTALGSGTGGGALTWIGTLGVTAASSLAVEYVRGSGRNTRPSASPSAAAAAIPPTIIGLRDSRRIGAGPTAALCGASSTGGAPENPL